MTESDDFSLPLAAPPPPPPVPHWPARVQPMPLVEHEFEFSGRGDEYFRIWIVNLALTILSLGIFSAWAKVRTERYFYGNTKLVGVPFEYLAKPLPILLGRIIAVVLFSAYVLAGQFSIGLQLGLALLVAVLAPWLLVRGLMFRARYSSWRGLSFRFVPDYGESYIRFFVLFLPLLASFGLLYPWVKGKQKEFIVDHHRYGTQVFRFLARPGQFYPPYLIAWSVIFAWMFGGAMLFGFGVALLSAGSTSPPPQWIIWAFVVAIYAGYFVVLAFRAAAIANLVYNNTEVGGRRFQSRLKGGRLLWIYASNTVLILVSAGLLIPWAMVRLAQYRASCLSLLARDDFNGIEVRQGQGIDAIAAEVDGLFDIDIGL